MLISTQRRRNRGPPGIELERVMRCDGRNVLLFNRTDLVLPASADAKERESFSSREARHLLGFTDSCSQGSAGTSPSVRAV